MTADPAISARPSGPDRTWTQGRPHAEPDATLWGLVVAQAERSPRAPAVRQWDSQLTYRELVRAAAALGERLRSVGIGPESRVGVCVGRSPRLPVALLGVLAAGGAYVALDRAHPKQRLADIVDDAGITVAVVDEAGREMLAGGGLELMVPSLDARGTAASPGPAGMSDLAYVLYTSGSTGRPKGVAVDNRSVASFVTAAAAHFALDARCRALAFSALGFDVSVLDMLTPLIAGGCVQLVPEADRADPVRLARFLREHAVTWGFIPPALLPLLDPDAFGHLADVITAGEPPGPEQVARWSAPPRRRLHNWYGPTEATVCVIGTELTGSWQRPVPIGRPLAGCQAYILDQEGRPCAPGEPGELLLGGPQVARGYWARPSLTAQRFVPDPFGDQPGACLFRTGDRAAWAADGTIEFLGRLDRQVKVRGQRVEIGEVETVLRRHPAVQQAVVEVVDGDLVGYLTPATAPDLGAAREHCARLLPGYMMPTRLHRMDTLPLTASGKTDVAALRTLLHRNGQPAPPRTEALSVEASVAQLWSEILADPDPQLDHDFFACGGHSLRAMRLVSALRARLGRDISGADLLAARTLGRLVERVTAAPVIPAADALPTGSPAALSPAQRRMWFVEHLAPHTPAHNIAFAERIRGPLDPASLRDALRTLVARHQPLRWRVPERAGVPYVVVGEAPTDDAGLGWAKEDLSVLAPPERQQALAALLDAEATAPFDLAAGPLWRARLVRMAADDQVLAITVHHIVFDGWSQDVLYRDLAAAYAAATAGEQPAAADLSAEFGDYVAELARRAERSGGDDLRWWVDRLGRVPQVCDLPRDRPRPPAQTFAGRTRQTAISAETAETVRVLARRLNTTQHAVLLAAFGQLLRRLTGQHELIVGVPYADRGHIAFEPLIGMLLQVIPVRFQMDDARSFAEHVRSCSQEVDAAVAHRDSPLERLVESLRSPRDLTRNPLIQVLFNMHNFAEPRLRLPGCDVQSVRAGLPGSLFDLTLYVSEQDGGWRVQAVYNSALYDDDRIDGYLAAYLQLLDELTAAPDEPVMRARARRLTGRLPDWTSSLPGPSQVGVLEQVAHSVAEHPDDVAVTGAGGELTYREVDRLRRQVASAVTAAGCVPGDTVAVLAARDVRLPGLLLGVLSTGARWAILDGGLPAPRLARQVEAAGARWLLVTPGVDPAEALPAQVLARLTVIEPTDDVRASEPVGLSRRGYLSFTSGTTGRPMPVVSSDAPLAGFLAWYAATFGLGRGDRFALLSGLSHDPMLRDAFAPLSVGAQLAVPAGEQLREPALLVQWLRRQRITVAHLTPQLARMLTADRSVPPLPELRLVAVGGDQLSAADVARLRGLTPAARLVNFYGTTETPQAHGWHEVTGQPEGDVVPVGRGVAGSELVVVDALGRPAAVGELGEVVIRSRRLASGYLDAAATRQRFAPTPGRAEEDDRLFRTGDLGRHRADGVVVLAGRTDDQVKVRGFRVELGEVEAALTAHPDVAAAAAIAVNGAGERTIRAFVAPAQPDVRVPDLIRYLRAALPEYAVPGDLQLIPAIPITANGKLDRAALPKSAAPREPAADQELHTATERRVAEIWRSVLGRTRVGAEENFFDVGGHSLALVAVAARLSAAADREIGVLDLFRFPTIRALAAFLDGDGTDPGIDRAARRVAVRRERMRQRRYRVTTSSEGLTHDPP